jgi:serine/threonine protein kinase
MKYLNLENSLVEDRYAIERCLGRGSFAEIFLARDLSSQRHVIIKALNVALQGTPDPALERTLIENFQNEAIALDKVRHPNIIQRIGHGTAADLQGTPFHYLVLEYMPGGDLLKLCRQKPLDINQVIFYFQQVSDGLAHAHRQGIIHRDIKPNNLLLSADRRIVKIADFGVARIVPAPGDQITRVGTSAYAPPEHNPDSDDSSGPLTPSADIYSLAKTIYTVMVGRAPSEFARKPITNLPKDLMSEPWGSNLLSVLKRATDDCPDRRYQTVGEFWDDFKRLVASRPEDQEDTIVRQQFPKPIEIPEPQFKLIYAEPAPEAGGSVIEIPIVRPIRPGRQTKLRSAISTLRSVPRQTWLRVARLATAIMLVCSLAWLAYYTYDYFSNRQQQPQRSQERNQMSPAVYIGKKGKIANALRVNLRASPRGKIVATLPKGAQVEILEVRGLWIKVKSGDDSQVGWVHNRYVEVE